MTKEIGYRQGIQAALRYLGEAHVAAGEHDAADAIFLESIAMSEVMGQVLEMAGTLMRVAQVRASTGHGEEAVTILASVMADSASRRSLLGEDSPIAETAEDLLAQLDSQLEGETFAQAEARGAARTIADMAKGLLADRVGSD